MFFKLFCLSPDHKWLFPNTTVRCGQGGSLSNWLPAESQFFHCRLRASTAYDEKPNWLSLAIAMIREKNLNRLIGKSLDAIAALSAAAADKYRSR
jgi:hypothetical protein